MARYRAGAYRSAVYRRARRYRSAYRRRGGGTGAAAAIFVGAVAAVGAQAVAPAHAAAGKSAPAHAAAAVSGSGEAAFWAAVLADLGAPATAANTASLTAWAAHEGPWGSVGENDPLDTTLPMPGSWNFNSFGGLHVQSYPSASEGAQATALTLEGGYPLITAALRSGAGLCGGGLAGEFGEWSGNGYWRVC